MKKNAIGHMTQEKRGFGAFLKKLYIFPFLLCAVLSVVLWLFVANTQPKDTAAGADAETQVTETEQTKGNEAGETATGA